MEPDGGIGEGGVPTKQIRRVIIEDPGSGYLPGPNGDLGGDNRTWAPADWIVVKRGDGKWEKFPPGTSDDVINPVTPGDGDDGDGIGDGDGGDGSGGASSVQAARGATYNPFEVQGLGFESVTPVAIQQGNATDFLEGLIGRQSKSLFGDYI